MNKRLLSIAALVSATIATPAYAATAIKITEVAAWSSSSTLGADWFELTNTGTSAINITGWKMDDNSNSFASSVALSGITSIAAGESVIFVESATALSAAFKTLWFGANASANLQIGNYSGSGVGLSASGDAVNIYNSTGVLQANVSFGASTSNVTFDNAVGLDGTTISTLSVVGNNGAFKAANDVLQIGSPGLITASVPESETYAMMLAGLAVFGAFARKRQQ